MDLFARFLKILLLKDIARHRRDLGLDNRGILRCQWSSQLIGAIHISQSVSLREATKLRTGLNEPQLRVVVELETESQYTEHENDLPKKELTNQKNCSIERALEMV